MNATSKSSSFRNSSHQPGSILTGLAIFFLVITLPLAGAIGGYLWFSQSTVILPGVNIGAVAVGRMDVSKAAGILDQAWNHNRYLAVSGGSQQWSALASDFGLGIDVNATLQKALRLGRGSGGLNQVLAALSGSKLTIEPIYTFHPEIAEKQLERWAGVIDQKAESSTLQLQGDRFVAVDGKGSSLLDVQSSLKALMADPTGVMRTGLMSLVLQPAPVVTGPAADQANRLNKLLDIPIRLRAFDPITGEWLENAVPRQTLAGWLEIQPDASVRMDSQKLADFIESWKQTLEPTRTFADYTLPQDVLTFWESGQVVDLDILHNPTQYTVQPGDTWISIEFQVGIPYWRIQQANGGLTTLRPGAVITIPPSNVNLTLPVVKNKRIVISISQQHLWSYEDGRLRTESVISTGIPRSPTMPGIFQVQSHDVNAYASSWDLWMPNFMGIYEAVPGFTNGIHGLPLLHNGVRLWGNVLGQPASYGCIILSLKEAEELYNWAENGVVVEIQR